MGRGFGRRLFKHAAAAGPPREARCLTIEADPNAEPFYRRMGAIRIGLLASEIDGRRRELPPAFDLRVSRGDPARPKRHRRHPAACRRRQSRALQGKRY